MTSDYYLSLQGRNGWWQYDLRTSKEIENHHKVTFQVGLGRISGQHSISGKLPDISRISGIWIVSISGIRPEIENGRISGKTGYPARPYYKQLLQVDKDNTAHY